MLREKTMNDILNNSYVNINGLGVRYSLLVFWVIVIAFIIKSVVFLCKGYKPKVNWDRTKALKSMILFISIILFYFWPYFLNSKQNIVTNIAQQIASAEPLLVISISTALLYGLVYRNRETYFKKFNIIIYYALYFDLVSLMIIQLVDMTKWYNILCLGCLGISFVLIGSLELQFKKSKNNQEDYQIDTHMKAKTALYGATYNYESLFESRKKQVKELLDIIKHEESNEGLSICVSGDWGIGKTSFANGLCEIVKNDEKLDYDIIRINALEIDKLADLNSYFFKEIKHCLKNRNIYVGVASEYQELILSSINELANKGIGLFIGKKLFGSKAGYRESKKALENLLSATMGSNKIVIIIDDIERCSVDKVLEFIFFIKEVATMKCCVSIFLADYSELLKHTKKQGDFFLDKFFNIKINLAQVQYKEIFDEIGATYKIDNSCNGNISLNIKKSIITFVNKFDDRFSKSDKKIALENAMECKSQRNCFIRKIENPRYCIKMFKYMNRYIEAINTSYNNANENEKDEIVKFLQKIKVTDNLVLVCFIQAVYPQEFDKLEKNIWSYVNNFTQAEIMADVQKLIHFLATDIWFEKSLFSEQSEFNHIEAMKFVNTILCEPQELVNISNGFTSREEKYFTMIETGKINQIDKSYLELSIIIIINFAFKEQKRGDHLLQLTFESWKNSLTGKQVKIDEAFEIFNVNNGAVKYAHANQMKVMEHFFRTFCSADNIIGNREHIKNNLQLFSRNYLPERLDSLSTLLYYYIEDNQNYVIKNARDASWRGQTCSKLLNDYISNLHLDVAQGDYKTQLQQIVRLCNDKIRSLKYDKYDDVKKNIRNAEMAVTEIANFMSINDFVESQIDMLGRPDIKNMAISDLPKVIDYLKKMSSDKKMAVSEEFLKDFDDLFKFIRLNNNRQRLNGNEIDELNILVTLFYNVTEANVLPYRTLLLNIENINKMEK